MKRYTRQIVSPKSKFEKGSFRTIDPGRPGHMKMVIGRLKAGPHKGKTRAQALLWSKSKR